ncbi:MAG: ATP-binding protein [Saprospiraceae bacterium]|nr:ATP-binding protein [Saprospiraceae bacterium]HRD79141.1 ATP-binding protein [Saprospiraceae bacterium]
MQSLIGRTKEISLLESKYKSVSAEFVAIYGRRRVGKTYLVREVFRDRITFQHTGVANAGLRDQLGRFYASLLRYFKSDPDLHHPKDWFDAFDMLILMLEKSESDAKKVVFLDELSWLDTRNSKFLSALEHFWNSWGGTRRDILLIVCGSAAAWMVKNLLNNKGGLHNRVTERVRLRPFTLAETTAFLEARGCVFDPYQIVLLYMVLGGIPFYLEKISPDQSVLQNVNALCFRPDAPLRDEYDNLYRSLFEHADQHLQIVEALSNKKKGLSRAEIIQHTGLANGGGLTRLLSELEESHFIRKYKAFGKIKKEPLYQLVDMFSLFHQTFIKKTDSDDENFWLNAHQTPAYTAWSGYAFEMVCLLHLSQIKDALGIRGVQTSVASWQSFEAQIDLVIDRKDQVINLCEMKFSLDRFSISKAYSENLRRKIHAFKTATGTRKAVFLTLISTYGLAPGPHTYLVQNDIGMEALFRESE